jgi:hypothetical protein
MRHQLRDALAVMREATAGQHHHGVRMTCGHRQTVRH